MKSRLTRKELNDLYDAKRTVASLREYADTDDNARKVVCAARETVARLSAKRPFLYPNQEASRSVAVGVGFQKGALRSRLGKVFIAVKRIDPRVLNRIRSYR